MSKGSNNSMSKSSNGNNNEVEAIFNTLYQASNPANISDLRLHALNIIHLMKAAYSLQLRMEKVGKPVLVPYKDLTDLVFDDHTPKIHSDALSNFRELVLECISNDEYSCIGTTASQKVDKIDHFMSFYDKVTHHIQLAQIQKSYIERSAFNANNIADKAQATAKEAKEEADKARKTYDTMFANYVTILGIFTAIIVTIFGGLNVVDTIISYGNTHFSTIVFLAALVLMCVVCLLYFLAKIILKLNGKDDDNQRFTLECLFGVVFGICLALILVAWCASPTKITPETDKKTSQDTIEQKAA